MTTVTALTLSALVVLLLTACGALPDDAAGGNAETGDNPGGVTDRDIDRAVNATLSAVANRQQEYEAQQTVAARVATARAPTPTLTPPGLPSLAGEAHDCFMDLPEASREAIIDDLVRYIHHWDDAGAMGQRAVFHHRDRFIRVLSRWDQQGKPGVEFMLQAVCPDGGFAYPPPPGR